MRRSVRQASFDLLEMSYVCIGSNRAQDITILIPLHRFAATENPNVVPVTMTLTIFQNVVPLLPLVLTGNVRPNAVTIVGMNALQPSFLIIIDCLIVWDTAHDAPHR